MKAGQKLVCIRDDNQDKSIPNTLKGEIYTFEAVPPRFPAYVHLREFSGDYAFIATNFRPTDDTFGGLVEEIISKQVEVEQMEMV